MNEEGNSHPSDSAADAKRKTMPELETVPTSAQKPRHSWVRILLKVVVTLFVLMFSLAITAALLISLAFWYALGCLKDLAPFVYHYPELSGWQQSVPDRHYLILFQNNNELRVGGGFISAYGLLSFRNGLPVNFQMDDVYNMDSKRTPFTPMPYPMSVLIHNADGAPISYGFRDANVSPDFPTNAAKLTELLGKENTAAPQIDGVISVNYSVLENLMQIVQPVDADGEKVYAGNLFSLTEHEVNNIDKHNLEALKSRKGFLSELSKSLFVKVKVHPEFWQKIIDLSINMLNQKEIQVYLSSPPLENSVLAKNWGGKFSDDVDGDVLAVNVANYGGMKSDRYIRRDVQYEVDFSYDSYGKLHANAKLQVKLTHDGGDNPPISGKYTGEIRVYRKSGEMLSKLVELEPGQEQIYEFSYPLADSALSDNSYKLTLIKQSGTWDHYLVKVKFPDDMVTYSSDFQARENIAVNEVQLDADKSLSLSFARSHLSAYITHQKMTDLKTVELIFNKKMDDVTALDIRTYQIQDADLKNPTHDTVSVDSVASDGRKVVLTISGVTAQDEEKYVLKLKNLKDAEGIPLESGASEVTLYQRLDTAL